DLAAPRAHYTHRVVALAVRLVVEDGLPYQTASWHLWRDHRVFVPFATIQNWVEARAKKRQPLASGPITSIGPSTVSRGTSPPTSCTTAPSASSRSLTTAPSSGCVTRSSTTTRLTGISERSSRASPPPP